ncbi:ferritin [Paenibacillus tianjinensis]|uniref:Ferritin n=1 Tax=Paenibacillus tianjinensis TaxID=2810347 RepID=A0ABX7L9W8_9BACL|nr:ferritin [Paenibacillus tianjinensis]QSF43529.1 ferritin [Paenibacillus tianjinensis]
MDIPKEINDLINTQIMHEGRNANAYLQVSAWFEEKNLSGFGEYFRKQAEDEISHKNKFIKYLNDRISGKVKMLSVPEITVNLDKFSDAGDLYIKLESQTTQDIYDIAQKALEFKDYMTFQFIQWFIDEQISEELEAMNFKSKLDLINEDGTGIILLNEEMEEE